VGPADHTCWHFTFDAIQCDGEELGLATRQDYSQFRIAWNSLPGDAAHKWRMNPRPP